MLVAQTLPYPSGRVTLLAPRPRSSASHCSIRGTHSSITDGRRLLTGVLGDRSSIFRYLRTVGSLTPTFLAIEAMESPFLRN